jgi:hypothetical protein
MARERERKRRLKMEKEKLREQARDLVLAVWRAMDWDKVPPSRRMSIYDELASKVRSAALTSDLGRFLAALCDKLGVRVPGDDARVLAIMREADGQALLQVLRDETTLIILMLREVQEARREAYAQR